MSNRLKKKDSPTSLAFTEQNVLFLQEKIKECNSSILRKSFLQITTCETNGKDQLSYIKTGMIGQPDLNKTKPSNLNNTLEGQYWEDGATNVICWLFVCCKSKHPARRAIASLVSKFNEDTYRKFCDSFTILLQGINNQSKMDNELGTYRHHIDMFLALMENFPKGDDIIVGNCNVVLEYLNLSILQFLNVYRQNTSPVFQTQIMSHCLTALKTVIAVLQKCGKNSESQLFINLSIHCTLKSLVECAIVIVKDTNILLECRSAAAILLPSLLLYFPISTLELLTERLLNPKGLNHIFKFENNETDFGDPKNRLCNPFPSSSSVLLSSNSKGSYSSDNNENLKNSGNEQPSDNSSLLTHLIQDFIVDSIHNSSEVSLVAVLLHGLLVKLPSNNHQPDILHKNFTKDTATVFVGLFLKKLIEISLDCKDKSTLVLIFKSLQLWVMECSRIILSKDCDLEKNLLEVLTDSVIPHFTLFVDHAIDTIRHNVVASIKECFLVLSKMQKSDFMTKFSMQYFRSDLKSRGKLVVLTTLSEFTDVDDILKIRPSFPKELLSLLSDVDLATHACNLYKTASEKHLKELRIQIPSKRQLIDTQSNDEYSSIEQWKSIWLDCVYMALSSKSKEVKSSVVNNIVPMMLKVYPRLVKDLVLELQNDTSLLKFRAAIVFLKTARSMKNMEYNEFDLATMSNESPVKANLWKDILNLEKLKFCLMHIDEQVRLDVMSLVCVSAKTNRPIESEDIQLVKIFLTYNMAVENPSFRQQAVVCLKKLLLGMFSHWFVLFKNNKLEETKKESHIESYRDFLKWLVDFLFSKLHLYAAYCQISFTLELLRLVALLLEDNQESFVLSRLSFSDDQKEKFTYNLLHMFQDTYDPNRLLVLEILTSKGAAVFLKRISEESLLQIFKESRDRLYNSQPDISSVAAYQLCYISTVLCESMLPKLIDVMFIKGSMGILLDEEIGTNKTKDDEVITHLHKTKENSVLFVVQYLITLLKQQMSVLKKSLIKSSQSAPVYSVLFALRMMFQFHNFDSNNPLVKSHPAFFAHYLNAFVNYGMEIIQQVSPYVSNEAPEGQLCDVSLSEVFQLLDLTDKEKSEEKSQDVVLQAHVARMILVCCWRSMKEVSLLLGTFVHNFSDKTAQNYLSVPKLMAASRDDLSDARISTQYILCIDAILKIWEMFSDILLRSKHAGAYELASVGFVKICTVMWLSTDEELRNFPSDAIKSFVSDLMCDTPYGSAQVTRRSAGLPFYLQTLCATEPAVKGRQSFNHLMRSLTQLCKTRLFTHDISKIVISLNILRAFFKDAKLCEDVAPYISDGVMIAVKGFSSSLWPIRNSCTLLFSSLMQRIFGVKKFKITGREFFSRFPLLYQYLLDQSQTNVQDTSTNQMLNPSVYPVLLLLSHLYPSTVEGSDTVMRLDKFIPSIVRCCSSPVYKVRTMAANALVPLISVDRIQNTIQSITVKIKSALSRGSNILNSTGPNIQNKVLSNRSVNQNEIHGSLLQIKNLLGNCVKRSPTKAVDVFITSMKSVLWVHQNKGISFMSKAIFVDILFLVFQLKEEEQFKDILRTSVATSWNHICSSTNAHATRPGFILYQRNCVRFVLMLLNVETYRDLTCEEISKAFKTTDSYQCGLTSNQKLISEDLYRTLSEQRSTFRSSEIDIHQNPSKIKSESERKSQLSPLKQYPSRIFEFLLGYKNKDIEIEVLNYLPDYVSSIQFSVQFMRNLYAKVLDCPSIDRMFPKMVTCLVHLSRSENQFTGNEIYDVCTKCLTVEFANASDELKVAALRIMDHFEKEFLQSKENIIEAPSFWQFIEKCSTPSNADIVRLQVASFLSIPVETRFAIGDVDVYRYFTCAINLLNDVECDVRDAATQEINKHMFTWRENKVDSFYTPQTQVVMEEFFFMILFDRLMKDSNKCLLFLLCLVCQIPFSEFQIAVDNDSIVKQDFNISFSSTEHKNGKEERQDTCIKKRKSTDTESGNIDMKGDFSQNNEIYKQLVVFEEGKENPYWNEQYIRSMVEKLLEKYVAITSTLAAVSHLEKYLDTIESLLSKNTVEGKSRETLQRFHRCKKVLLPSS